MGAAWLRLHLWEHYAFAGDREFLRERGYPALKDAALFLVDFLVADQHGRLLSGPVASRRRTPSSTTGVRGRRSA